jgi:hypothetical protein
MRFAPKTDAELADAAFAPGTYDFEVAEAEDTVSKAGNEMISVKLRIFNKAGGHIHVFDWLLEAMAFKLKHATEAMGLADAYRRGELEAHQMIGRAGRVICVAGDNGYLKVKDYEVAKGGGVPARAGTGTRASTAATKDDLDDSIPF